MDNRTRQRLNQINRDFYRTVALSFDQTRQEAWLGWLHLLAYLRPPLSVLDIGCGNGRFGVFLHQHLAPTPELPIHYHGLDNNDALLDKARVALAGLRGLAVRLSVADVVEEPHPKPLTPSASPEGEGNRMDALSGVPTANHHLLGTPDRVSAAYSLVVVLGVMHHIPGAAERQSFLRAAAEQVAVGGLLVFACWRFYEYERFRKRLGVWPDDLREAVEANDYLLDWRQGQVATRYCHYVDDAEHAALVSATGLEEIATYRADGETGDANRYSVLRRNG